MPLVVSAASGGGSGSLSLLVLTIPLALFGYLILAQRRRAKRQAKEQDLLAIGDVVMSRAGMFGVIASLDGPTVTVRIAPEVVVRFDRRAVVPATIPPSGQTEDAAGSDSGQD